MPPILRKRPAKNAAAPVAKRQRKTPARWIDPEVLQPSLDDVAEDGAQRSVEATEQGRLVDLPLDILFSVFRFLRPADLLCLARTNKAFRDTLMTRNSENIWKATHANVGPRAFPKCPSFMSEPRFADLAFGTGCHKCGLVSDKDHLVLDFFTRLCSNCFLADTMDRFGLPQVFHARDRPVYLSLHELLLRRSYQNWFERYYIPEIDSLKAQIRDSNSEEARSVILGKWKAQIPERLRCTFEIEPWMIEYRNMLRKEAADRRDRRCNAIVSHLESLGFHTDIGYLGDSHKSLREHHLVDVAQDLTDEIWEEIQDEIVSFMEKRKTIREKWDNVRVIIDRLVLVKQALEKYLNTRSNEGPIPRPVDLTIVPEIADVLNRSPDAPQVLPTELCALIPKWEESFHAQLVTLVTDSMPELVHTVPELRKLACLTFKCQCGHLMRWDETSTHTHPGTSSRVSCIPGPSYNGRLYVLKKPVYQTAVGIHSHGAHPWNARQLGLRACGRRSRKIFELCGKDPTTATIAEMDGLDVRFECHACGHPGRSRAVMDWREALYHCDTEHLRTKPELLRWSLADETIIATVKNVEGSALELIKLRKAKIYPQSKGAVVLWGRPIIWLIADRNAVEALRPTQRDLLHARGSWLAFPGGKNPETPPSRREVDSWWN